MCVRGVGSEMVSNQSQGTGLMEEMIVGTELRIEWLINSYPIMFSKIYIKCIEFSFIYFRNFSHIENREKDKTRTYLINYVCINTQANILI